MADQSGIEAMNRKAYRIVNETGDVCDTKVFTPEGVEIRNITSIEIHDIIPGGKVRATLHVLAELNLVLEKCIVRETPFGTPYPKDVVGGTEPEEADRP